MKFVINVLLCFTFGYYCLCTHPLISLVQNGYNRFVPQAAHAAYRYQGENIPTFTSAMANHQKFTTHSLITSSDWKYAEQNYYDVMQRKYLKFSQIPDIFHLVWLWGEAPESYKQQAEKIKELHPQAQVHIWTALDAQQHDFYNKALWNSLTVYSDKQLYYAYELLYAHGGVYISPFMNLQKSLSTFLKTCSFFAGIEHEPEFMLGVDILGSSPKHPLVKLCLDTFNQCRIPEFSQRNRIGMYEKRDIFKQRYKYHLTSHYKREILSLYSPLSCTRLSNSLYGLSVALPVNYFYPCPAYAYSTYGISPEYIQKKWIQPYTYSCYNPVITDTLMRLYTYRPEDKILNLPEQPCVAVVLTHNNQEYCIDNITSILDQAYENFRVIIINDNSTDKTEELILSFIKEHPRKNSITYIKNKERLNIMANHVAALALCKDNEIVVHVDGDDHLSSPYALKRINAEYIKYPKTLLTYGSYVNLSTRERGFSEQIPHHVLTQNSIRNYKWVTSHIRTFRAWLFKQIKTPDLQYKGKFVPCAADVTFMLPMIEMAGKNARYIHTVLGIYNDKTPQNIYKTALATSQEIVAFMRSKKPYQPLKKIPNFI